MIARENESLDGLNSQESFESSSEGSKTNESDDEEVDNDEIDSISSFDYVMNDFTLAPPLSSSPTERILRQMVERQTPPPPFRLILYYPQPHYQIPIQQNTMNQKLSRKQESNHNNAKNNNAKKRITVSAPRKTQKKTKKQEQNSVRCGCKSSNCIKLYCHCFQGGKFCASTCSCVKCYNTLEESKKRNGGKRKAAIHEILKRKPNAFSRVSK
jgi:hypothetical protein